MQPEIVVLGNFVVDIIGRPIDRLPERGRLLLIDALETHVGGNGPNTAGALGRLGAPVAVAGRVGDDLYGRFLLEHLDGWGVHTGSVTRDPAHATGVTLVPVDSTGERSFLHHFGANAHFGAEDLDWDLIGGARHLHLTGFYVLPALDGEPAARVLAEARRRGLSTSVDVCWDRSGRWLELLRPCLPYTDLLMPSEEEGRRLTGCDEPEQMAARLHELGGRTVVLKLGERGCLYSGPEGVFSVPAYRVQVRDTTGAGDCFCAGF
ncbi:MAG TPA: carbohydrate kinase family protein, partial [Armatimonadota bacterium]|nr:carbohydrate kinase family protein [Armatimonadota bacterium]